VIDIDPGKGGADNLRALEAKLGALPTTRAAKSGGGGAHYFFKHPGVFVLSTAGVLAPGVDVRADLGYIVVASSSHMSGGVYEWRDLEVAIADLPRAWLDAMVGAKPGTSAPPPKSAPFAGDVSAYAHAALQYEVAAVRLAPEGTRNARLWSAAKSLGQLVGGGALDRGVVERELVAAGLAADPEEEKKTRDTVARGIEKGMLRPRTGKMHGASGDAGSEEIPHRLRAYLEIPKIAALFDGQCGGGEESTPSKIDFSFVMQLALHGVRDRDDLELLLRHRLRKSERAEKALDHGYVIKTVDNAVAAAERIVLQEVDPLLHIATIVRREPEGVAEATTYVVTGVAGWTMEIDPDVLLDAKAFLRKVLQLTGHLPLEPKSLTWLRAVTWALEQRTETVVVPGELSEIGHLEQVATEFLAGAMTYQPPEAGAGEDVVVEPPWPHRREDGVVVFKLKALLAGLCADRGAAKAPTHGQVRRVLGRLGCDYKQLRFGGRRIKVWTWTPQADAVTFTEDGEEGGERKSG
jgi:hypothetical protein